MRLARIRKFSMNQLKLRRTASKFKDPSPPSF
jgi:hypothetical protein